MNNFYILCFNDGLELILYSKDIYIHKEYFKKEKYDFCTLLEYCKINGLKAFATGRNVPIHKIQQADKYIREYGVQMNEPQLINMGNHVFRLINE